MKPLRPPILRQPWYWWRQIMERYGIETRGTLERYLGRLLTSYDIAVERKPQAPGRSAYEVLGLVNPSPVMRLERSPERAYQQLTKWIDFADKVKIIDSLDALEVLRQLYSEMQPCMDKTQFLAAIDRQIRVVKSESE